jgi:hypothetical protein
MLLMRKRYRMPKIEEFCGTTGTSDFSEDTKGSEP